MSPSRRIAIVGLCLALAATAFLPSLLRANAPIAPKVATHPSRTPSDIDKEMHSLDEQVTTLMPSLKLMAEPEFRNGDGQKVLPLMQKIASLNIELEAAIKLDPRLRDAQDLIDMVHANQFDWLLYSATLGDKNALATLDTLSKAAGTDALLATNALTFSRWLLASKDAPAQQQLIDNYAATARAHPEDVEVLNTLSRMNNLGISSPDLQKKIIDLLHKEMKGPNTAQLLAMLEGAQEQLALVGKPLALAGRTSTGSNFDTTSYAGKVVLLDFWATWCGPCVAELPNVKKAYASLHDKGFEIVGVSCDSSDVDVNNFIREKEMPWVQLRESTQMDPDEKHPDADRWHPLAHKYRVDGIPQMFLIDRNGILRYVDAREDLEKKIAELVAEPVKPASAKPPTP